jgi:uncharacterized membrane protein YcaP (DUF421 family)
MASEVTVEATGEEQRSDTLARQSALEKLEDRMRRAGVSEIADVEYTLLVSNGDRMVFKYKAKVRAV